MQIILIDLFYYLSVLGEQVITPQIKDSFGEKA
jgi:hypothetical protein